MINLDITLKDEDLSWAHWTNVRQLQVDIYVVQHDHMPLATLWKLELFDRSCWRHPSQLARKHVEAFTKTTTSVIEPSLTHGYENWPVFDVYVVAPDLVSSSNSGLRKTASHEQLLLVVMCKAESHSLRYWCHGVLDCVFSLLLFLRLEQGQLHKRGSAQCH